MNENMEKVFTDERGEHEGGCGWDPMGHFCGECSNSSCEHCGVWAHTKAELKK